MLSETILVVGGSSRPRNCNHAVLRVRAVARALPALYFSRVVLSRKF